MSNQRKLTMKRLGLITALVLTLAACNSTPENPTPPAPTSNVFVGQIAGTDGLIALVFDGQTLTAYTCGGEESWQALTSWFEGSVSDNKIATTTGEWGLTIEGTFDSINWTGSLKAFGKIYTWTASATKANSPAGLYVLNNDTREAGLIIDNTLKTAGVYYGKSSGQTATVQVENDLKNLTSAPAEMVVNSVAYGGSSFTLDNTKKPFTAPKKGPAPQPEQVVLACEGCPGDVVASVARDSFTATDDLWRTLPSMRQLPSWVTGRSAIPLPKTPTCEDLDVFIATTLFTTHLYKVHADNLWSGASLIMVGKSFTEFKPGSNEHRIKQEDFVKKEALGWETATTIAKQMEGLKCF